MSATTAPRWTEFAGIPLGAWAFALHIWTAVVLALCAAFWLQLEAPSTAAITVAILALPTRGQVLEKATFRLFATIIGVTTSIVIVGAFAQARDLLLGAVALWIGLCVYAAGLLDGSRAYAAVLSGYTVAFIAVQQMDTPQNVFESSVARGAAIAIGIAALAVVNTLLAAPDNHALLASRLAAIHQRVRAYVGAVLRGEEANATTAAEILRDIAALRPEMATLVPESSSGPARSAAARSTAVALVAELHAARALAAVPAATDPRCRETLIAALEHLAASPPLPHARDRETGDGPPLGAALEWGLAELLRRDAEVRQSLTALGSGSRPPLAWRTPFYRSHRLAAEAGARACFYLAAAAVFFVLGGWPDSDFSLSLVVVIIGLGATTPTPLGFTIMALVAAPIAGLLAGILKFVILDGATAFPLLAIALAPFVIGAAILMTRPNPLAAALGRLNLIFIPAILAPTNPQHYNPQTFLFTVLFVGMAAALLLAVQRLVPPVSDGRRRQRLTMSARHDLDRLLSWRERRLAAEEAMFRDAVRIGQIVAAGGAAPQHRAALEQTLVCFDQA
ncbi:MAG TPA: FUSC family protein, partial [Crenalkalicoccus sp.]|nr:FUSC family protein [Crenalkalicoccus sp.]